MHPHCVLASPVRRFSSQALGDPWRSLRPPGKGRSQAPLGCNKSSSAQTWLVSLGISIPFHLKGSTTKRNGRTTPQRDRDRLQSNASFTTYQPGDLGKASSWLQTCSLICTKTASPTPRRAENNNCSSSRSHHPWPANIGAALGEGLT